MPAKPRKSQVKDSIQELIERLREIQQKVDQNAFKSRNLTAAIKAANAPPPLGPAVIDPQSFMTNLPAAPSGPVGLGISAFVPQQDVPFRSRILPLRGRPQRPVGPIPGLDMTALGGPETLPPTGPVPGLDMLASGGPDTRNPIDIVRALSGEPVGQPIGIPPSPPAPERVDPMGESFIEAQPRPGIPLAPAVGPTDVDLTALLGPAVAQPQRVDEMGESFIENQPVPVTPPVGPTTVDMTTRGGPVVAVKEPDTAMKDMTRALSGAPIASPIGIPPTAAPVVADTRPQAVDAMGESFIETPRNRIPIGPTNIDMTTRSGPAIGATPIDLTTLLSGLPAPQPAPLPTPSRPQPVDPMGESFIETPPAAPPVGPVAGLDLTTQSAGGPGMNMNQLLSGDPIAGPAGFPPNPDVQLTPAEQTMANLNKALSGEPIAAPAGFPPAPAIQVTGDPVVDAAAAQQAGQEIKTPEETAAETGAPVGPTDIDMTTTGGPDVDEVMGQTVGSPDRKTREKSKEIVKKLKEQGADDKDILDELGTLANWIALEKEQPGENFWNMASRAFAKMDFAREANEKERRKLLEQRAYDEEQKEKDHDRELDLIEKRAIATRETQRLNNAAAMARTRYSTDATAATAAAKLAQTKADAEAKRELDAKVKSGKMATANAKFIEDRRKTYSQSSHIGRKYTENYDLYNDAYQTFAEVLKTYPPDDRPPKDQKEKDYRYQKVFSAVIKLAKARFGVLSNSDIDLADRTTDSAAKTWMRNQMNVFTSRDYTKTAVESMMVGAKTELKQADDKLVNARRSIHESHVGKIKKEDLVHLNTPNIGLWYSPDPRLIFQNLRQADNYVMKNPTVVKMVTPADDPDGIPVGLVSVAGTQILVFNTQADQRNYYAKYNIPSGKKAIYRSK